MTTGNKSGLPSPADTPRMVARVLDKAITDGIARGRKIERCAIVEFATAYTSMNPDDAQILGYLIKCIRGGEHDV